MRAIDVHVHPMNQAYVEASMPFIPAAQRMFKGKFEARPDSQIADDFRRDDALAIPIAWDADGRLSGVPSSRYCLSFRSNVLREIPSAAAAAVWFPPLA